MTALLRSAPTVGAFCDAGKMPALPPRCHHILRTSVSESVGASYLNRNWPEALKESGAWSLLGLRQSILNGSLTRLLDPDSMLRKKIVEFVEAGDFGLGSAQQPDGTYQRV